MIFAAPVIARTYFIQAEKTLWNYTDQTNVNHCMSRPYNKHEDLFVLHSNETIGSSYWRGA
jgi:hypothetical protein